MKIKLYSCLLISLLSISSAYAVKGGSSAREDEFASVVGLPNCTGIFIHPRIILTAAHCLPSLESQAEIFKANRRNSESYSLEKYNAHPEYSPKQKYIDYDVAYILLREPITDPKIIKNIPKLDFSGVQAGDVIAVGMGYDRKVTPFLPSDYFLDMRKKKLDFNIVETKADMFFISPKENGTGVCGGDSGGALFSRNAQKELIYIGNLVAMGGYCGEKDTKMYAERFYSIYKWIQIETGITLESHSDLSIPNPNPS